VKFYWLALTEFNLSPAQGLLMYLVHGLSRRKGWCFASKAVLAKFLNVSKPTIYSLLKELEGPPLQLIERKNEHLGGMNSTLIRPTQRWEQFYKKFPEPLKVAKGKAI